MLAGWSASSAPSSEAAQARSVTASPLSHHARYERPARPASKRWISINLRRGTRNSQMPAQQRTSADKPQKYLLLRPAFTTLLRLTIKGRLSAEYMVVVLSETVGFVADVLEKP